MRTRHVVPVVVFLLMGSLVFGQLDRGVLTGVVTDPSGAAVVDAKVTVTHLETNVSTATATTETGNYTVPALLIGRYRIAVEAAGFKRGIRDSVVIAAGSTVRLDVSLELGSVAESIEVGAQTTPLETESTRVATNITNKLVEDLPLVVAGQIRSVFNLATLAPEAKSASNYRIGGGQGAGWDMLMDGLSLASASSNYQTQRVPLSSVPVDAVAEFTVETTGMKAEYGRAMGFISFATKSGTNEFHGNGFEFLRNDALDARGFFADSRPILRQHDFGGTFGGPVRIPKLYDGRDRTFFFVSYEGFRSREGNTPTFNTVPYPEMYEGDFSNDVTETGVPIVIFDPATTRADPSAFGGFARDPFPGRRVPQNRFSQVATKYIALRPADMLPNRAGPRLNYFRQDGSMTHPWNKGTARIDHRLTDKDSLSFLFVRSIWEDLALANNPSGLPMPFNGTQTWARKNSSGRFTWNRTVTSRILNSLRVSYQAESGDVLAMNCVGSNRTAKWGEQLGLKNTSPLVYNDPAQDVCLPPLSFDFYTGWAGTGNGYDRGQNFNIANDLSIVTGPHTFKTGFFFSKDHWDGGGQHRPTGSYSFTRGGTKDPAERVLTTGNALASMLLGYVSSTTLETPRKVVGKWKYLGGFFQDDWRVNKKLTLNLGLRWEYTYPSTGGAVVPGAEPGFSNFDPNLPNPAAGGLPGAMIFSGKGEGRTGKITMFDGYRWAFSPRLGIAYALRPGTVIRAYGGRSFEAIKTTGGSTHFDGFIGTFTWSSADGDVRDFPMMLDEGLPHWEKPPFLRPEVSNNQGTVDWWQPYDAGRPPEFWTWSYDIQQQLGGNSVFTVRYSGSKGTHLLSGRLRVNQTHRRYLKELGPSLYRSDINSAAARAANIPIPYPGFRGTVARALQPFPQYQNISTSNGGEKVGNSTYHALVLMFDKRYSSGLTFLGSYVFSKMFSDAETANSPAGTTTDHYNRGLDKGLSSDDQTHVTKLSFSYEFPFGRGKPFLNGRVADRVFGGWSIAAITEYAGGAPLSLGRVFINSYTNWRAPMAGERFDPFKDFWWKGTSFNQVPLEVMEVDIGNATKNNPKERSPFRLSEDVSLAKNIPITERVRMVFRFEAFNLFNRVRWGNPSGGPIRDSAGFFTQDFGLVRSQGNTPRQMQLALKVHF